MQQKIIVFGSEGQISSELKLILKDFAITNFISHKECDFTNKRSLENFLNNIDYSPDFIINTSAYTNVELAEDEKEKCNLINGYALEVIADFCKKKDITLIHYSTDYVFKDKDSGEVFSEENTQDLIPINEYGRSKLLGENFVLKSGCKSYIIRVSWLYSKFNINFVKKISTLLKEKEEISVISDKEGSPTYAKNVAELTLEFIKKKPEYGIYNLTDEGFTNWYEFALEIKKNILKYNSELKNKTINPVNSNFFTTKAKRIKNSKMSKDKIKKNLKIKLKNWKDSLGYFFKYDYK